MTFEADVFETSVWQQYVQYMDLMSVVDMAADTQMTSQGHIAKKLLLVNPTKG
jgi:hypothetical protein